MSGGSSLDGVYFFARLFLWRQAFEQNFAVAMPLNRFPQDTSAQACETLRRRAASLAPGVNDAPYLERIKASFKAIPALVPVGTGNLRRRFNDSFPPKFVGIGASTYAADLLAVFLDNKRGETVSAPETVAPFKKDFQAECRDQLFGLVFEKNGVVSDAVQSEVRGENSYFLNLTGTHGVPPLKMAKRDTVAEPCQQAFQ
jgi:hypothetical protein